MPCLVQEGYHPKIHGGYHCKSLASLVKETYAHCHVPCLTIPAARWSSDEDTDDDDALDTKQVILNEMRNREMKKQRARCSVDGGSPSSLPANTFFWSFTPLDPRGVVIHMGSGLEEVEETEAAGGADDESEAFFSVKSFFTCSTSRAATMAWSNDMYPAPRSPATWEGLRDCEGWPFGLCRRPTVPPLPRTPDDSWKWRNRSSNRSSSLAVRPPGQSPTRAYPVRPTRCQDRQPLANRRP